ACSPTASASACSCTTTAATDRARGRRRRPASSATPSARVPRCCAWAWRPPTSSTSAARSAPRSPSLWHSRIRRTARCCTRPSPPGCRGRGRRRDEMPGARHGSAGARPSVGGCGGPCRGPPRTMTSAYGSDLVVDLLRAVGIAHVALNPGATFRGLHDSLVNHGKGDPELILTLHEEIAVALAHGYAKARGAPMAAAVHDIVGLQHASMAIFNAFCDRAPILVLGATGPMDATRRRPWIDWIHTALVQGTQVRDYVKLDDQPASVAAIPETLLRSWRLARTEPQGPVYLCLDAGLQEEALERPVPVPDVARFPPAAA